MSDLNSDSSPEEGASFMKGKEAWNHDMRGVFAELNRLRESLVEKDKEINRLHRETHKLKSVIEKSELTRIPSLSSYNSSLNANNSGSTSSGKGPGSGQHVKKCGVSGESWCIGESSSGGESGEEPLREDRLPQRHHKDFRTRQLIRSALADNDFLGNLDRGQVQDIVDFMFPQTFAQGEFVIREGEPGSHLYVSAEGNLYVSQDSRNLGTLKPGVAFGELALLYNCKRTASVRAITECKVWALDRSAFRLAMVKAGMQKIKDRLTFLRSVPLLKGLDAASLGRIADCLEVERYPLGAFIIREGAAGDTFFIISEGRVQVTSSSDATVGNNGTIAEMLPPCSSSPQTTFLDSGECHILRELGHGDYFGEQALLHEERRSANVVALSEVEVLTLDRESFLQLIGDLSEFALTRIKTPQGATMATSSSSCSDLEIVPSNKKKVEETVFFGQFPAAAGFTTTGNKLGTLSCSLPNPSSMETSLWREQQRLHEESLDFSKLTLDDLEFIATLGVGGFGRVELVQISHDPSKVFALKCLPKVHILATQQQEHVYAEKNIMLQCNSQFIARLYRTFRDDKYVYMLMEACLGGEVWTVLRDKGNFDEDTTRFIAACVLLALEYLHERNVIYRDLKPENLMLANDGYVKLVDFGFSKIVPNTTKTWTFCGTPEYCAPEVILNKGHDRTVDFWALGILLFELLTGCPPWGPMAEGAAFSDNSDQLATYNAILKGIDAVPFTKNVSKAAVSLIRRLCRQVPGERMGARSFREITGHRWWQGFDWDGVRMRKVRPPISPRLRGPTDTSNFDKFEVEIEDVPDDSSGWDEDF